MGNKYPLTVWNIYSSWHSAATERNDIQGGEIWSEIGVLLKLVRPRHRALNDSRSFINEDTEFLGSFPVDHSHESLELCTSTSGVAVVFNESNVPESG